jgi:hypothetical protein
MKRNKDVENPVENVDNYPKRPCWIEGNFWKSGWDFKRASVL